MTAPQNRATEVLQSGLAALMITAVVVLSFSSGLGMGFFAEDYRLVDWPVRMSLIPYLVFFFNPTVPAGWYRPVQGLQFGVEYALFGNQPAPYHIVQILIHVANSLLLYLLIVMVTRRKTLGLASALIYAGLPQVRAPVLWVSVTDPLASFFYLLTIALWVLYLRQRRPWLYVLAVIGFVFALLSKEIGVTLPVTLVAAELLLVGNKFSLPQFFRRYLVFGLILLPYGWFFLQRGSAYLSTQYKGPYAGLSVGPQIPTNLATYLRALADPWGLLGPAGTIWLVGVAIVLLSLIALKRRGDIAFVVITALIVIIPVLPLGFSGDRYLYLAVMASATLLGLAIESLIGFAIRNRFAYLGVVAIVAVIVWGNWTATAEAAENLTGLARQLRTPVRQLFQSRSEFPADSYLYFINSPIPLDFLSGMFSLRYGANAIVSGPELESPGEWRQHRAGYVYYFDDETRLNEIPVDGARSLDSNPPLPVDFNVPIRLLSYETMPVPAQPGRSLVVLLDWQARARIADNYTVFAHLVNAQGETVEGSDSEPQGGKAPTGQWQPNKHVPDWAIITIPAQTPPGEYRLEVGWYYRPTMERLSIVDGQGRLLTDHIAIGSIMITQ